MTEEELEKEAKQSYLDNTDHMQWDEEGEFDYTRGYLNGAEPREKRIEELEKELAISEHDREHNDYELTEVYKKVSELEKDIKYLKACKQKIIDLQKENAELKEEMKAKQVVLNDFKSRVETVTDRFNRKSSQLTKAKEIIKEFVMWANWNGANCPNFKDIQSKAEQFLKEIEK